MPPTREEFNAMAVELQELKLIVMRREEHQIQFPVSTEDRINMGIGWIDRGGNTTPGDSIIVNSPEGPIEILIV